MTKAKQKESRQKVERTPMALSFESPESSSILGAAYDPTTQEMVVRFVKEAHETHTFRYSGIPLELWREFIASPSKGQFFTARMRPLYDGVPIKPAAVR